MIFQQLFFLSLAVAPASAWVPVQSTLIRRQQQHQPQQRLVRHMSAVGGDDDLPSSTPPKASMDEMVSKIQNFDVEGLLSQIPPLDFDSFDLAEIQTNVMDGTVGERGEIYVAAQFGLLACLVGGGIPFVGDALMILLGPVLLLAGAAAFVVSLRDLGSPNLSPWKTPPPGGNLVKEGIYGSLRHPQYAGVAAMSAGFSIATGSANRLLLTAVLFYVLNVLAEKEEEELQRVYPDYQEYANQVEGRFFPDELLQQLPWN